MASRPPWRTVSGSAPTVTTPPDSLHAGTHIEHPWSSGCLLHGLCSTWEIALACWKHFALSSHSASVMPLVVRKAYVRKGKLDARNFMFPSPVSLFSERRVRTMPAILRDLRIVLIDRKVHGIRGFGYSHISIRSSGRAGCLPQLPVYLVEFRYVFASLDLLYRLCKFMLGRFVFLCCLATIRPRFAFGFLVSAEKYPIGL
jgi:hypothetical protein